MVEKEEKGITVKKDEDFSEWYQQMIIKADLADYTKVSGCIVFKPNSWVIWEKLVEEINKRIKKMGVKNVYFPLLIPESLLNKEKEHVEGFSPEVAWVTQTGNKKLDERLAVRPTSEAIMYDSFSKWIRSWRDLPLKYNQWSNIIRWEFKHPSPFFRTREFVFNEGHTVYATEGEAEEEQEKIIGMYEEIMKEFMALPGLIGKKTDKEKFAGAVYSTSIEIYMSNGKTVQGPVFHNDGQNFAKAYDIKFVDEDEKEKYVWQNTWALSTRMLGVIFAVHGDDKGVVIPPRLADNKIVIVPIFSKENKEKVMKEAEKIKEKVSEYSPILDDRSEYSPGWKFNEWELKGIPIRMEIGMKEIKNKDVVLVKRNDGKKINVKIEGVSKKILEVLEEIHKELYEKAEKSLKDNITKAEKLDELIKFINNKKIVLVPMCKNRGCEEWIQSKTNGAKTLNRPFKQNSVVGKKCIYCGKDADYWVYMGKTY